MDHSLLNGPRHKRSAALALLCGFLIASLAGCGSGSSSGGGSGGGGGTASAGGTLAGTYAVTVTATIPGATLMTQALTLSVE
jgi:hypothetical protein